MGVQNVQIGPRRLEQRLRQCCRDESPPKENWPTHRMYSSNITGPSV